MTSTWNKPTRILIHAPNWVGDHVMAFGFYHSLKALFSDSEIVLIGRKWVSSLLPDQIFSETYTIEGKKLNKETRDILIQKNFDLGITLSPSFRSALTLFRLKIPMRIGYKTDSRAFLLKTPRFSGALNIPPYSIYEHRSLSYIRLLTPWLPGATTAEEFFMDYTTRLGDSFALKNNPHQKKAITGILHENGLKHKKFWIICPGSVAPSKVYPLEHLAHIITSYIEESKREKKTIVFIGSKIEKEYVVQLREKIEPKYHKHLLDLTEKTLLDEAVLIMRSAAGIIANDSGIAHMAALTSTPLITFLGMGRKEETITLSREKTVFNLNLPCSPCMKKKCPRKDHPVECLKKIPPDEVYAAMLFYDKKTKR